MLRTLAIFWVLAVITPPLPLAWADDALFGQKLIEGFPLLKLAKVQKDLRMSRGQVLRVIARDQAADAVIETAPPNTKATELPELLKKQEAIREKAVREILDEKQQKRLQQLTAQQLGASLLLRKEIEQALKLTDSQRYKLYLHHQDTIEKVKSIPPEKLAPQFTGNATQVKIRKIKLTGFNHMLNELTPEQRKKFREMLGPPLKLD